MECMQVVDRRPTMFFENQSSPEELTLLDMRTKLMSHIREIILARKWTQCQAGEALGIGQSRVSDLLRGKREKFSLDMLVTLATRLGQHVELALG